MKRRQFLTLSCLAGVGPVSSFAAPGQGGGAPEREYYELRLYQVKAGPKEEALDRFLGDAAIPAFNRIGIQPVGVFRELEGDSATRTILLPHPSLESVVAAGYRMLSDARFVRDGAAFLDVPKSDPTFNGIESSLMMAFPKMPRLKAPEKRASRIFELRTYESHSPTMGRKKVEMFNEGGEIDIFLKTGLTPVFFGETLIGGSLPNLTYMLAFDDMEDHDKDWKAFQSDPAWQELKSKPEYKDTVSRVVRTFLRPLDCSQI